MNKSFYAQLVSMLILLGATACSEKKEPEPENSSIKGVWRYNGYTIYYYSATGQLIHTANVPGNEEVEIADSTMHYYRLPDRALSAVFTYHRDGDSLRIWSDRRNPATAYFLAELNDHVILLRSQRFRFLNPFSTPNGLATFSFNELNYNR